MLEDFLVSFWGPAIFSGAMLVLGRVNGVKWGPELNGHIIEWVSVVKWGPYKWSYGPLLITGFGPSLQPGC